jgi:hypothetical protein
MAQMLQEERELRYKLQDNIVEAIRQRDAARADLKEWEDGEGMLQAALEIQEQLR